MCIRCLLKSLGKRYGDNMKIVNFKKAGMTNFCCHIDPVELEFQDGKLILITGPNGSGKTAIFQSIPYTLYGLCEKGKGEDVLNDLTGESCHTFVEFEIDSVPYRVDRYVKAKKFGTTATLRKGNAKPYKKGHKEVVPEIERLLIPRKLFMNTLLFSQKVKTFFTDLTDSEQKEIFRKILKLDDFVLYQKESGKRLKEVETQSTNVSNSLSINGSLLEDVSSQIARLEVEKSNFYIKKEEELKEAENQIGRMEKNVLAGEEEYNEILKSDLDKQLEDVNKEIGTVEQLRNSIGKNLMDLLEKLESKRLAKKFELENSMKDMEAKVGEERRENDGATISRCVQERTSITTELEGAKEELSKIRFEEREANQNIEFLQKEKELFALEPDLSVCPTCHQEIDETTYQRLEGMVEEIDRKVDESIEYLRTTVEPKKVLEEREQKLQVQLDELNESERRDLDTSEKKFLKDRESILERFAKACEKLDILVEEERKKIEVENESERRKLDAQYFLLNDKKKSIEDLITRRTESLQVLTNLKNVLSTLQENLEAHRKEEYDETALIENNKRKDSLIEEKNDLLEQQSVLERKAKIVDFWKVGFSSQGIQSMLIDEAIPFMNRQVGQYLDQLSDGRYTVSFDTMGATKGGEIRDKIAVNIFDNRTHADSRVKISGGQERIVDIATILTLADLQSNMQDIKFNLLLFDEIFDSLDDENISRVSKLLRVVTEDKSTCIISHRHIDAIEADDYLRFY